MTVGVPGYLIDTQTITYWFDGGSGKFPSVEAAAGERAAEAPLYVSAITLGEIEFGYIVNSSNSKARKSEFLRFVREKLPQVLEVSRHTAEPYGRVRAALVEKFPPSGGWKKKRRVEQLYDPVAGKELGIDENDLWITAQAVERNLILVTADKMHRIREALVPRARSSSRVLNCST